MSDLLFPDNAARIAQLLELRRRYRVEPRKVKPILFRPCQVRILLVADGFLYFSDEDFGLSDLIGILAVPPGPYVRFQLTCAHRADVSDAQAAIGNPDVSRSIKLFRFDDAGHFAPGMYDEVWLFGSDSSFQSDDVWQNKPDDSELQALAEFMDSGGGLFATGDHGALGSALGGFVPRVRSMRMWFAEPGPFGEPVAPDMTSAYRNDTNRPGHAPPGGNPVFEFDDQSDDIPQEIQPKVYTSWAGPFGRAVWPHPVLCGPRGTIRVLPDHPHEGECIEPWELDRTFDFGGAPIVEYPPGTGGRPQPLPEVIATSTVLAGNAIKDPTVAQSFGAIGTYDGDAADIGRVAVDATWHHFININLTGTADVLPPNPKAIGFLASSAGQAAFEEIKAYYRNLAVWLAPAGRRRCMRWAALWAVIWEYRLIEAVTPGIPLKLHEATLDNLWHVGTHARDALGNYASRCQSLEWTIDIVRDFLPWDVIERFRPWPPFPDPPPDPVPWLDEEPLLDLALGAAVIAIREQYPSANQVDVKTAERRIPEIAAEGTRVGLGHAFQSLRVSRRQVDALAELLQNGDT
jgi:hypothetical protein